MAGYWNSTRFGAKDELSHLSVQFRLVDPILIVDEKVTREIAGQVKPYGFKTQEDALVSKEVEYRTSSANEWRSAKPPLPTSGSERS